MRTFAVILLATLSLTLGAQAQAASTESPRLAFEVATVKLAPSDGPGGIILTPANFRVRRFTLAFMIKFAYQINSDAQLTGGPSWINSTTYDVTAKADDAKIAELSNLPFNDQLTQMRQMLQTLLADRFALKLSSHVEDLPAFTLVVAKGGPKIAETEAPPPPPSTPPAADLMHAGPPPPPPPGSGKTSFGYTGQNTVTARNAGMDLLAGWLSHQPDVNGRIVVDKTGLRGKYDYVIQGVQPPKAAEEWTGASIFTLLQEQLGLRLQPDKVPTRVFTVEHAEQPSAN